MRVTETGGEASGGMGGEQEPLPPFVGGHVALVAVSWARGPRAALVRSPAASEDTPSHARTHMHIRTHTHEATSHNITMYNSTTTRS